MARRSGDDASWIAARHGAAEAAYELVRRRIPRFLLG
jgi:hypothetical protein